MRKVLEWPSQSPDTKRTVILCLRTVNVIGTKIIPEQEIFLQVWMHWNPKYMIWKTFSWLQKKHFESCDICQGGLFLSRLYDPKLFYMPQLFFILFIFGLSYEIYPCIYTLMSAVNIVLFPYHPETLFVRLQIKKTLWNMVIVCWWSYIHCICIYT